MYKTAIIGAGPAGLLCGSELRKLGENTIIFEKDTEVGEPVECAGLFNIDGLKRLGISEGNYVLNKVRGARFISSEGNVAELKGDSNKAFVVDRSEFDRFLAKEYSGELELGSEVKEIRRDGGGYKIKTPSKEVSAETVVLATGYNTGLHNSLGFEKPVQYIATSQYEIEGTSLDSDFVELYVGSVAPGFFAWIIPTGQTKARIGLGVLDAPKSTHHYMQDFLKRLTDEKKIQKDNEVVHKSGGLIPVYSSNLAISNSGAYLVGDAAGQVKASTGGGVMIGGLCAQELAKSIHNKDSYEMRIEKYNKELKNHLLIRKVINKFGDEQYGRMVEFLNKPEVKKIIEESGDMDFVGPLMKMVMKNPMLMMQAAKFMGKGIFF